MSDLDRLFAMLHPEHYVMKPGTNEPWVYTLAPVKDWDRAKAELDALRDAELVARAMMKLDAVGFWFHARLDYWSDEQQAAIRSTGLPALTDAARDALRKAIT